MTVVFFIVPQGRAKTDPYLDSSARIMQLLHVPNNELSQMRDELGDTELVCSSRLRLMPQKNPLKSAAHNM